MPSVRFLVSLLLLAAFAPLTGNAAAYALCIRETPARIAARTDPTAAPAYWSAFATFGDQLKAAGILRSGSAFDTSLPAKTVQPGQAADMAKDVPRSSVTFGGYFVIEVASEAEALAWAARVPNPGGSIEIYPLLPTMAK